MSSATENQSSLNQTTATLRSTTNDIAMPDIWDANNPASGVRGGHHDNTGNSSTKGGHTQPTWDNHGGDNGMDLSTGEKKKKKRGTSKATKGGKGKGKKK